MQSSIWRIIGISCMGAAALGTGGCIPQAARDDARLMAALTTKVRTDGEKFAAFRTELDQARQLNTDILEDNALESEQAAQTALQVWRLAEAKNEIRLFDAVREDATAYEKSLAEVAALRQRQEQDRAALVSAVQIRSDDLAATADALGKLAEAPDFKSQVKFLIDYGKAVNESLKKAEEQAKKDAEAAKKASSDQKAAIANDAKKDKAKVADVRKATTQPATQPAPPPS